MGQTPKKREEERGRERRDAKNGTDMKRFVSPYFRFCLLVSGANSRRFFSRVFRSHLLVIGALRDDSPFTEICLT
jgi:hypothetical protein